MKPSPAPFDLGRKVRINKPKAVKRVGISQELRDQLRARCGGKCEVCGEGLPAVFQAHHRKLRSQGGQDSICNLVAAHSRCHLRIHSHPVWAMENGFIVSREADPATSRLGLRSESWVILSVSGCYEAVEAA